MIISRSAPPASRPAALRKRALPYTIYDRDQIARSGVVNLSDFLATHVIDGNASVRPPDQDAKEKLYVSAARMRRYAVTARMRQLSSSTPSSPGNPW